MRWRTYALIGVVTALSVLGWAAIANAQGFQSGDIITIAQSQTLDKTLFAAGRNIDIAGTVNGDVFCAGQDVTISGKVTGDVICAGQSVHISGTVDGNIRVAGQNVTINGTTGHNLTVGGQDVSVESSGNVRGDATIGGQTATVNGSIGRDLALGSTDATINGKVGRDVQSSVNTLTLGSTAIISGNLTYTSAQQLSQAPGARVVGITIHKQPKEQNQHMHYGAFIRGGAWFALYLFVALLIVALVLVLLAPQMFHVATEVAIHHPGRTFLVGFAASIVAPAVIVLLMATVVGIPLGVLAIFAWLVALFLSGPFAAYYVGRLLLAKNGNALLIMLIGAVVLLFLYFVPFIGFVVSIVAMWFGLGIIFSHINHLPKPRYDMATVTSRNQTKEK